MEDNYDFTLVGQEGKEFGGYVSTNDPTDEAPNLLVRGSKNVYKNLSQRIQNRCGMKRWGAGDDTDDGVVSSYEWYDSLGRTFPFRVLQSGKLQFESEIESPGTPTWYDLYTDADHTRYCFAPWWDNAQQKDLLLMVKGDNDIISWSGGVVAGVGDFESDIAFTMEAGSGYTNTISFNNISEKLAIGELYDGTFGFVLHENPVDGDNFAITFTGTPNGNLTVIFQNSPTPDSPNAARITIGATKEDTLDNLLDFFANPGTANAMHNMITDADTITAIGNQTFATATTLEVEGTRTWLEAGFLQPTADVPNPTITSNGLTFSYDMLVDRYMLNVDTTSGLPSGITWQTPIVTEDTPTDSVNFSNDFCIVNNNQFIVGSYSSRLIYGSKDDDYTDFTPVDPASEADLVGYPFILTLDDTGKGFAVRQGNLQVSAGLQDWYEVIIEGVQLNFATDQVNEIQKITVNKKPGAVLSAALGQEFIVNNGDDIYYVAQDHQIYVYGAFTNQFSQRFPMLSQQIRDELSEADLTGGALRSVVDELYLTAPVEGLTYIYSARQYVDDSGNIQAERLWYAPMDWNISRIAVIDGVKYGASAENPQYYQLFDTGIFHDETPTDATAPYECKARWAYWNFGDRSRQGKVKRIYIEGYISANSDLSLTTLLDYLGSTDSVTDVISSLDVNPRLYTDDGVIPIGSGHVGGDTIGGGGLDEFGNPSLPKFRAINVLTMKDVFEYQFELSSFSKDSRWEILCIGTNGKEVINKPTFLQLDN